MLSSLKLAEHRQTVGRASKKSQDDTNQKDVYVYPLISDARAALVDAKKSPSKKAQPFKTANFAADSHIFLWQKIITIVSVVADEFDQKWQKRNRILNTLLIVLFIFRLFFPKTNKVTAPLLLNYGIIVIK